MKSHQDLRFFMGVFCLFWVLVGFLVGFLVDLFFRFFFVVVFMFRGFLVGCFIVFIGFFKKKLAHKGNLYHLYFSKV